MRSTPLLVLSLFLALLTPARSAASALPDVRARWDGCDPSPTTKYFDGPHSYRLVISGTQFSGNVSGSDIDVFVHSYLPIIHWCGDPSGGGDPHICEFPDAWRFDDGGCQSLSRLTFSTPSMGSGCPSLAGANAQALSNAFMLSTGQDMHIRFAETFDNAPTDPANHYTILVIDFDHTHTSLYEAPSGVCGNAYRPLWLQLNWADFLIDGAFVHPPVDHQDDAYWYGDPNPVPTQASTWGRLKALYH